MKHAPRWTSWLVAATSLLIGACTHARSRAATQSALRVVAIDQKTSDQLPLRGLLATVLLSDPDVQLLVTPQARASQEAEAKLATLDTFAVANDCDLVINTNYFAVTGPGKAQGYKAGVDADILGLCVQDGNVISPARSFGGKGDPALLVFPDRRATIAQALPEQCEGVKFAAAGIGASETDPDHGALLVSEGKSTAREARVDPLIRHPRTAAGVSRDGRTLYLLVLDGRQPDWSAGATLEETATILRECGAWDAVNLDGGGSTMMLWKDPKTGEWRTNRPSGGAPRPVAAGLGIRIGRRGS
ncbi:MAG: phosphodiester glycosidase family protein [Planctomycetota bacterium]|nr:phosphodiester glycosidase family protein [Planctomycetota bacterium]